MAHSGPNSSVDVLDAQVGLVRKLDGGQNVLVVGPVSGAVGFS